MLVIVPYAQNWARWPHSAVDFQTNGFRGAAIWNQQCQSQKHTQTLQAGKIFQIPLNLTSDVRRTTSTQNAQLIREIAGGK